MTSSAPVFEDVKATISKKDPRFGEAILAIFPWGSRIYQCSTPESDYDFIGIIEDGVLPVLDLLEIKANGSNAIDKRFIVLEEGLINVTLISYHDWRVCLLQHHHECLEVLFTPRNLFLFESDKIKRLLDSFVLDKDMLRRTVAWESKRRFTRSVFPARDTMRRGKKDLVHALRYLLFALQMFEHDRIIDFTCANDYYRQIVLGTDEVQTEVQFKQLMQKWEPERYRLSHLVGSARVSRRFYGRSDTERRFLLDARARHHFDLHQMDKQRFVQNSTFQAVTNPNPKNHPFQLLDAMLSNASSGIVSIEDQLPVVWYRNPKEPEILILYPRRLVDDLMNPIIQVISNGAVLKQSSDGSNSYEWLALGLPSVFSNHSLSDDQKNTWNARLGSTEAHEQFLVEELVDGTHVTMYWNNDGWKLASRIEPVNPSMTLSFVPINDVDTEISLNAEFWKIWHKKGYKLPSGLEGVCFTFILNSDVHRYVVRYEESDIYCVHARNMKTGVTEDHRQISEQLGWKLPEVLESLPRSISELEKVTHELNPLMRKGYILKSRGGSDNAEWDAFTVKNSIYTSIRYGSDFSTIGQLNMRVEVDRKLLLCQAVYGTGPRFLEAFPYWKSQFEVTTSAFKQFCGLIDSVYLQHWRKEKKDFVAAVETFEFRQTTFRLSQNRYPCASEFFATMAMKQQHMILPWREFLKKYHEGLWKFYQGDDEEGAD